MSLILALGSNRGDRVHYLERGRAELSLRWSQIAASRIYESLAVDYCGQPPFLNQLIEYALPPLTPWEVLAAIGGVEKKLGRIRTLDKGPRTLDIDIIFWGTLVLDSERLHIPHPRWAERAFVYWPLHELPGFGELKRRFFHRQGEVPNDLVWYSQGRGVQAEAGC